jgi:hypothetical protein
MQFIAHEIIVNEAINTDTPDLAPSVLQTSPSMHIYQSPLVNAIYPPQNYCEQINQYLQTPTMTSIPTFFLHRLCTSYWNHDLSGEATSGRRTCLEPMHCSGMPTWKTQYGHQWCPQHKKILEK